MHFELYPKQYDGAGSIGAVGAVGGEHQHLCAVRVPFSCLLITKCLILAKFNCR
eukprot:SAG31_NODE_17506_length_668_cov_1.065026_1_plen_54_part_10